MFKKSLNFFNLTQNIIINMQIDIRQRKSQLSDYQQIKYGRLVALVAIKVKLTDVCYARNTVEHLPIPNKKA